MTESARPLAPPDPGLQPERTSLAWARTWAVLGADVLLTAKFLAERSALAGALALAVGIVPLIGLTRVRQRHELRVRRFVARGPVSSADLALNLAIVAAILAVVAAALVGLAVR